MMIDFDKIRNKVDKIIDKDTKEELEKHFGERNVPLGWVDIGSELPHMSAMDILTGTTFKVKDKNGKEFYSKVMDHDVWYHIAKEQSITHWWNE